MKVYIYVPRVSCCLCLMQDGPLGISIIDHFILPNIYLAELGEGAVNVVVVLTAQ